VVALHPLFAGLMTLLQFLGFAQPGLVAQALAVPQTYVPRRNQPADDKDGYHPATTMPDHFKSQPYCKNSGQNEWQNQSPEYLHRAILREHRGAKAG
jgi:hypothetical protein